MQMNFKTSFSVFVGAALLVSLIAGVITIRDMQLQIEAAISEKAKSDIATALEIADYMHPGSWRIENNQLYKGDFLVNGNTELVDRIARLTDDTVTIFLHNTRVATTIMRDGCRAIGTVSADYVAETVLNAGNVYIGEAEVIGTKYQTCYAPIKDEAGNIIGMFYMGVSKNLADQLKHSFTAVAVLSARITLLFALAATSFIPVESYPSPFKRRIGLIWPKPKPQNKKTLS